MRLVMAEMDGGQYFHGYAVDDDNKYLFDVRLVTWLNHRGVCIVKSVENNQKYLVNTACEMIPIE